MFDALKKYMQFSGRAKRKEFCLLWLMFIVLPAIFVVAFTNIAVASSAIIVGIINLILLVSILAIYVIIVAVTIRRLHDIDRSGWWIFLIFSGILMSILNAATNSLPAFWNTLSIGAYVVGLILWGILAFKKGTDGANRFGDDPLQE
ncbi:MAG: DUF805 domain-containing protein [Alphaproteobacteria bacterium]|nr:DUF805 domain-containing protein [Alphaproteobacteria bacterium]